MQDKHGLIFIVAAASGTGKTTLVRKLLSENPNIKLSISHTTRDPRVGEQHGEHYFFTTEQDFVQKIEQNEFLEYAKVFHCYYGTSLLWIEETVKNGYDVLLEIDVQGAAQVKEKLPEAISIFILPPDIKTLTQRLVDRKTESEENIKLRLSKAENEITQASQFDYIVINDQLDTAAEDLSNIIRSEHLKTKKQMAFLQKLLAKS